MKLFLGSSRVPVSVSRGCFRKRRGRFPGPFLVGSSCFLESVIDEMGSVFCHF